MPLSVVHIVSTLLSSVIVGDSWYFAHSMLCSDNIGPQTSAHIMRLSIAIEFGSTSMLFSAVSQVYLSYLFAACNCIAITVTAHTVKKYMG